MALQDLTPQLRTRMTRVERLVGLFVFIAAILMAVAFAFYLLDVGQRRGWFVQHVPYYCYTRDATGLKPGDPVRLLGRDVGQIVQIDTTAPDPWFVDNNFNVFVKFEVRKPYFGYIWTDSRVRIASADFFGPRYLEITRGSSPTGLATVLEKSKFEDSLVLSDKPPFDEYIPLRAIRLAAWPEEEPESNANGASPNTSTAPPKKRTGKPPPGVWLQTEELPQLTQRAEQIIQSVQDTVPVLTGQITQLLAHATAAVSNANLAITRLQPTLDHVESVLARVDRDDGAIGRMILTTNLQDQVGTTLGSMDATLTNTTALIRTSEQQLQDLTRRLALTLDNVALVTSNLSAQVNANSLVLGEVSSLVVTADDTLQGLKRHWLLRSAFQGATNPPLESVVTPRIDSAPR